MVEFEEALSIIDTAEELKECEKVGIYEAVGRVVCDKVISGCDLPPFNKATMDGFACRYGDVEEGLELRVRDMVYAGDYKPVELGKGECVRIMTGAPVPDSCDTVVEFEKTEVKGDRVKIIGKVGMGANIAYRGEDLKKGEVAFDRGTLITPSMINLFASLGMAEIPVRRRLTIGIVTTGDELVEIHDMPTDGQIRDSSSFSLIAQIRSVFQIPRFFGIVRDDKDLITEVLSRAVDECDIILITGGSSFGDKDFAVPALKSISAHILTQRVAMKPGKPTVLARSGEGKWIVGMPGNPVSTYSVFKLFVQRLIARLLGSSAFITPFYRGRIDFEFKKKPDRVHFVPCKVDFVDSGYVISELNYHGSGDFTTLSQADAFFVAPKQVSLIERGSMVEFYLV